MYNQKNKRIAVILGVLMLAGALTACGQDASVSTADIAAESSTAADESSKEESSVQEESSAEKDETSKADSKAESKADSKTESKSDSKADSKSAKEASSQKDSSSKDDSESSAAETTKAPENQNSGDTPAATTAAETTVPDEDDADEPEPTKYIYLQDTTAQYSGDGISVEGNVVNITKGGTYELSGNLEGQIFINTEKKKVKLHLNNASIHNPSGSAINCQNAKKLTVNSLAGTVNYLEDGGEHDADKGTIFSEDTVNLKGEGELNITAHYAHGVQSDDDIIVNGSTINITAAKSCLHSNDGIEINAGNLYCDGGTNGIKTDGYITVTGGNSVFLGGTREEKGAVYCDGVFTISGGQFWAIGNTFTAPDAMTTSANVIGVTFANSQAAGTIVNVVSGGNNIFTMTSPRNFKYVVYTGPNLLSNAEYQVNYGGSCEGDPVHYIYNGAYTAGTDGGSFTAGNNVTFYTVS